ncbi:MASE3 domain-containing protein [Desulfosporosinus sp. SYSU MS00001]|uniref:MASE3 domain-containing protein n=1 Tax=Desulfosporosinus sp. SYSU MS00001 TaxID=3416284 RepID=UPI003CFB040B
MHLSGTFKNSLVVLSAIFLLIISRLLSSSVYLVIQPSYYLALHTILETFSIVVSLTISFQCIILYPYTKSDRRLFLGILFLMVGFLDMLHTLSYKGMPFFGLSITGERATYFWLVARISEAIGLVLYSLNRIPRKKVILTFGLTYLITVCFIVVKLGYLLPPMLNKAGGVTGLKVIVEYIICFLDIAAIFLLSTKSLNDREESNYLIYALFLMLLSEIIFTFYKNVYDIDTFIGHVFKVIGFSFLLRSILVNNVKKPFIREITSKHNFDKVFQFAPVGLAILEKSSYVFLEVNESFGNYLKIPLPDIIGKTPLEIGFSKQEWHKLLKFIQETNYGLLESKNLEVTLNAKENIAVQISIGTINFKHKECLLCSFTDITKQKRLQESLKTSEERLLKVFKSSPSMISIVRKSDNSLIDVNDQFLSKRGFLLEEVIGKTPIDVGFPPKEYDNLLDILKNRGNITNYETKMARKDGLKGSILVSGESVKFNGEEYIIFSTSDITELKRLQAEIFHLDRLNLVAQMAAGIGHEIRNPMTTVRGYLQLLGVKPEYSSQKSIFELMISELDRANSIISEFLSLARTKKAELELQNLNGILNNLYPLLEADTFNQNKQIEFVPGTIPDILINKKEITQLVLNLTRNGLEAMKERGRLRITTFSEMGHVVLTIEDEGCGISDEDLAKLGTPFFTTKDYGTGLGLATCFKIAQNHQAKIDIDSGSQGTKFIISFPVPLELMAGKQMAV